MQWNLMFGIYLSLNCEILFIISNIVYRVPIVLSFPIKSFFNGFSEMDIIIFLAYGNLLFRHFWSPKT